MRINTKLRICGALPLLAIAACGLSDPEQELAPSGATPQVAQTQEAWHAAMRDLATPSQGCFQSDFPLVAWKSVPCVQSQTVPYPPSPGGRPQTVGHSTDFAAIPTGTISAAEGSFDGVSGVTSIDSTASGGISEFSLQLNTRPFASPMCGGSPNPACQGWQQFVYSNSGVALIQYWLLVYNTACPAGWNTFMFPPPSTDIYCFKDSFHAPVPHQAIANLINLKLGGTAASGSNDSITLWTGGTSMFGTSNPDNILSLAAGWTDAEFNIFGDANSSQAVFNAGSSVTVRTTVHNGTTAAPACALEGFTGETNNLTLIGTPALAGPLPSPGIVFNMTNSAPFTPASCATAMGTGDPHLHTVLGTGYDFQGIGDYLWAQRGQNFVVQTRQISGAPSWPLAAVNKEVATRMGKSRIAVCSLQRLEINGKPTSLADGKQINLPDATVERHGNVFLITGASGDSVRAQVNAASPNYIDVQVGFGQWPDTVLGLLGNGKTADELVARDGTVLTAPVSFEDLYSKFGDSWRVAPKDSLLCSNEQVERRNPDKPFCVKDLDPKTRDHAQSVCGQFGIKQGPLLDACILDVAMLGDAAAQAFVNAPPPVVVGDASCR